MPAPTEANRWNAAGEPTRYLAGDRGVLLAEFARHLDVSSDDQREERQVWRMTLQLDRVADLREPRGRAAFGGPTDETDLRDPATAQALAARVREHPDAQALLVPSMAFLDDPERWCLCLFADRVEGKPGRILGIERVGTLCLAPQG